MSASGDLGSWLRGDITSKWCDAMTQSCKERGDLYRQKYWPGQSLRSRDLTAQAQCEEQLRWWHNRAVHHVYGILEGYEVSAGSSGDVVMVSAGLAYDSF